MTLVVNPGNAAELAGVGAPGVAYDLLPAPEQLARPGDHDLTGRRQAESPPDPGEDRNSEILLDGGDLPAERGLGDAEALGRAAHV